MFRKLIIPVILFLSVGFSFSYAQTIVYPVQSDVFLTPPYSLRLSDYASPSNNKFTVQLLLKENQKGVPVNIRLRLIIEDPYKGIRVSTKSNFIPSSPIVLQSGIPLQLTGAELEQYLLPSNIEISGIDANKFLIDKKLPEGQYTFRAEVYEYYRGVSISHPNIGSRSVMIIENNPPIWILPIVSSSRKIDAKEPQNIVFSWSPRHQGTIIAEYEFTLVEIPENANIDPNVAISTLPPLFITSTRSTNLVYDLSDPQLIPGRHYVCQIRAKEIDNLDVFKNDGKSEAFSFIWGETCKIPFGFNQVSENYTSEKLSWLTDALHKSYEIKYREVTDSSNSEWYTDYATNVNTSIGRYEHTITNLKPAKTYQYQVKAGCNNVSGEFSQPLIFKTSPESSGGVTNTCGQPASEISLTDNTPIEISVGQEFYVGGLKATLTEITSGSASAGYAGKCVVYASNIGLKINSHFLSIKINKDKKLFDGKIIGDYDPNNLINIDNVIKDAETAYELEKQTQDALKAIVDDAKAYFATDPTILDVILDLDTSNIIPEDTRLGLEKVNEGIKDKNRANQLIQQGRIEEGETLMQQAENKIDEGKQIIKEKAGYDTDKIATRKVTFTAASSQRYGFDEYKYTQLKNSYEHYYDNNQPYGYSWKSFANSMPDEVSVDVPDGLKGKVVFKTDLGETLTLTGNQLTIGASGNYVKAFEVAKDSKGNDSLITVGKLNLARYETKEISVKVIPVNGAIANIAGIENTINSIYKQAAVKFNISTDAAINIDDLSSPFIAEGLDALSNYTSDMNAVIDAYKTMASDIDNQTYYLFVVNGSNSNRAGFMPLSRQWGFIFADKANDANELASTYAHELGHGVFRLRHTFSDDLADKKITQGTTNNLMDYPGSGLPLDNTHLFKSQWDNIHNAAFDLYYLNYVKSQLNNYSEVLRLLLKNIENERLNRIITSFNKLDIGKQLDFIKALNNSIVGIDSASQLLINNLNKLDGNIVDAWKLISTHSELSSNYEILVGIKKLLTETNIDQSKIRSIVDNLIKLKVKCSTCPSTSGENYTQYMKSFPEILDDISYASKYFNKPEANFTEFIAEMGLTTQKSLGGSFQLRILRESSELFNNKTFNKWERSIDDLTENLEDASQCTFDLNFIDNSTQKSLFIESKSWDQMYSLNDDFKNQLRSHLNNIENLNQLLYIYDGKRIGNINLIVSEFKKTLTDKNFILSINRNDKQWSDLLGIELNPNNYADDVVLFFNSDDNIKKIVMLF